MLTGNRGDALLTLFSDQFELEFQQQGSILAPLFSKEMMTGQKNFFHKMGSLGTPRQITNYYEPVVFSEKTFERRQITFTPVGDAYPLDGIELAELVADPRNDLVRSLVMSMGRQADTVIMNAIQGNAVVTINGSTTNVALPSTQKIAVSDITYDLDLTAGDKGLTPGKLMKAKAIMDQHYARGDLVVIAPAGQLGNLLAHARASSRDYFPVNPLQSPGFDQALSGYLGMQFVRYEDTGIDANLDELVFVVTRDALKTGSRIPLEVQVQDRAEYLMLKQIKGVMDLGAVRMFEEAVVQIACDPRKI